MIKLFNRISSLVLLLSAPRAATAPDLASAQEQTPNTNAPADVPVTKHGYLDVRKLLIVCVLLMLGWPLAATADCPSSPDPSDPHFNDALREFSADMCRESDAPLIFGLDPSMKPRLQMPSAGHRLTASDIYPYDGRRLSFEGSPIVAFVVELDGSVQHSRVVVSSGHRVLDAAEWAYWKQYKFDSPGQFDGAPARVLVLERMDFKLKGATGLPASFSDGIIDDLGRRILQPYTLSDPNALYQDLDETAKGTTSPGDIQRRFANYALQFGAMRYGEYKGLKGVKNVGGVNHYELMYRIHAAVPRSGAATLFVTAVDRQPRPGIIGFEIK
jgi:TonB family protein